MKTHSLKPLLILLAILATSGCKYYDYHQNSGIHNEMVKGFWFKDWNELDEEYILVIHLEGDSLELYEVIYNQAEKSIMGRTRPFDGLQYSYYRKAKTTDGISASRPYHRDKKVTQQVHFFVNHVTRLDKRLLKFRLEDINHVDTMKPSYLNPFVDVSVGSIGLGIILWFVFLTNPM